MKLLTKEFRLCMHPFCFIAPLLSALVLVPGYPYAVCCFYMALGVYFICLSGRENHDAAYTLTLPVTRRDAVLGRILFVACLEVVQLLLMELFILLKNAVAAAPNPAGLDAGVALIGQGFIVFALFNMIFFPLYYRDITKPGKAFMIASAVLFAWIILEVVATYAVPFVRFSLDTPDPLHMRDKLLFLLGGLALFLGGTYMAFLRSAQKFGEVDLSL